jgi:hypothetical protein
MRPSTRVLLALGGAALLAASPAAAGDGRTLLGSAGEVYTVQRGAYGALFVGDLPDGASGYPVLALDVVKDGQLKRLLVPGTDGPEDERDATLAFDSVGNRVYVVWQSERVFTVAGYGAGSDQGWQQPVDLAGDPASTKRNPQLATSVVRYLRLDAEGNRLPASRVVLHLVYSEDGAGGERLLYTAAAIEGGAVLPAPAAFELRALAGSAPPLANAPAAPASLRQRPAARHGRDTENVGLGFIDADRGELVTLELRPIDADLHCFADKARAVIIDLIDRNPGIPRDVLADKARAVIIDLARRLMHPVVADFLSRSFLERLAADATQQARAAADAAWAKAINDGITLQQGSAAGNRRLIELAAADADGTSRALDLRWVSRRALPPLPAEGDLKLFLSPRAQEASVAWNTAGAVRYRETKGGGWDSQRTLALGPTLSRDQAYKLVEQRLDEQ